jgi:hypothetical protein
LDLVAELLFEVEYADNPDSGGHIGWHGSSLAFAGADSLPVGFGAVENGEHRLGALMPQPLIEVKTHLLAFEVLQLSSAG